MFPLWEQFLSFEGFLRTFLPIQVFSRNESLFRVSKVTSIFAVFLIN